MKFVWKKKQLIFDASRLDLCWASHSALTPTPIRLNKDVIRIYAGFRDKYGVSRIGYVDVDYKNPATLIDISSQPCLDIGDDGRFDDNGVILGDVATFSGGFRMYYIGFQLVKKAKFLAFTGLAESVDGEKFRRVQDFPILDRDDKANAINAIHSVLLMKDNGEYYRVWHAKGDDWQIINGEPFPRYNIWSSTSSDGVTINKDAKLCVDCQHDEYRIGRPSVYRIRDCYVMFYTKAATSGRDYYPGIALSKDGVAWERQDDYFKMGLSDSGWDSRHISYPRLLAISENRFFVFYNGNDMGRAGFGYAELTISD